MISSTMPSAKYSCSGSPLMFANGSTAIDGLSGSGRGRCCAGARSPTVEVVATRYDPHRPGDVLELLLAHVLEGEVELAAASSCTRAETQMPPGSASAFEPRRDVDAVAEDVVVLDDDVAQVDADAELDALVGRDAGVALGHLALHLDGAAHRVDDAGELDQQRRRRWS